MKKLSSILLIDDDETSNFITERQLRRHEVCENISIVLNGLEAKKYILNSLELPQVVFVDINMPLMNGFEFLEWFEHSEFKGQCKFFFYSTSIRTVDKEQACQYTDVIDYIEKPLTDEKILQMSQMLTIDDQQ